MSMTIQEIIQRFSVYIMRHRIRSALLVANVFFGVLVIRGASSGVLPLGMINFVFFSFLLYLTALYRPTWVFLPLVGMLPYEIIDVAPMEFGFSLRPYQWLMVILWGALLTRVLFRRPAMPMFRWKWVDILPLIFFCGAGISTSGSSFLPVIILGSFIALYFLTRIFVRTQSEIQHLLPFILSSFGVVAIWSIIQNIWFIFGKTGIEVMAGRPNGTFPEADWLGMYLLLIVAISLAWIYHRAVSQEESRLAMLMPFMFLFSSTLILVLSVARSAWLGMLGMGGCFALAVFLTFRKQNASQQGIRLLAKTLFCVSLAFLVVPLFHLSRFDIFDRAISTSGVQKITIACDRDDVILSLPEKIENEEQLSTKGCRHIFLEAVDTERATGKFITTIYRDDPNVSIRHSIYERVISIGMEYPLLGIGWGNIGAKLGLDERGAALNASNMFLEFWLGSGLLGLIAFSLFWFGEGFRAGKNIFSQDLVKVSFSLFFFLAWIGITIFNLFNSGILLGFFFFFLGLGALLFGEES